MQRFSLMFVLSGLLLLFLVTPGCSTSTQRENAGAVAPVLVTDYADLDYHVGQPVTIRGKLERTKMPQVMGVGFSYADLQSADLYGKNVQVTGKLHRYWVQAPKEGDPIAAQLRPGKHFELLALSKDHPVTVEVIE